MTPVRTLVVAVGWLAFCCAPVVPQSFSSLESARDWLDTNPTSARFGSVVLEALALAESLDDATAFGDAYASGIPNATERAEAFVALARTHEMVHRLSEAERFYRQAVSANPSRWDARLSIARIRIDVGDTGAGIELLSRLISDSSSRVWQRRAGRERARALHMEGDSARALREVQSLVRPFSVLSTEPADVLLMIEIAESVGDPEVAADGRELLAQRFGGTLEHDLVNGSVAAYPSIGRVFSQLTPFNDLEPGLRLRSESDFQPTAVAQNDGAAGIQVGSFRDRENARYMAEQVEAVGFDAVVVDDASSEGGLHRVVVPLGPGSTPEATQDTMVRLKEYGIEGFLVFDD